MDKTKAMMATVLLNGIIWVTGGIVTTQAIKTTGRGEWGLAHADTGAVFLQLHE